MPPDFGKEMLVWSKKPVFQGIWGAGFFLFGGVNV